MTTNYPAALDDGTSLPTITGASTIDSATPNTLGDAIKELEGKVGIAASTPDTDQFLVGTATGESEWTAAVDALDALGAQAASTELDAIAALDSTGGYIVKTGANTYERRTFTVGSGLSVTNGSGVAGATSFDRAALTGDVTAIAGGNSTTLAHGNAGVLDSGTLLAARMPALTGDVTTSAGAVATTIATAAVTLAKMADLAQDKFIGRTTASTGVPQTATITAAARTVLDDTTVGAMATTLGLGTGDTPQFTALDLGGTDTTVTRFSAGRIAVEGTVALLVGDSSTNLHAASTQIFLGRNTAGSGYVEELGTSTAKNMLNLVIGTDVQAWDADLDTVASTYVGNTAWTPALRFATVGGSTWTGVTAVGRYWRVGPMVYFTIFYTATLTKGSGSGNLQLTGWPVTPDSTASTNARFAANIDGYTKANYTFVHLNIVPGSTTAIFIAGGSGQALAALTAADMVDGTVDVIASGFYWA